MQTSTSLNKLKSLSGWQQSAIGGPGGWLFGFLFMVLAGLANPVAAQSTSFTNEFLLISGSRAADKITPERYYTQMADGNSTKPFDGQDLGEGAPFTRNSTRVDSLFINAEANTFTKDGDNIQSVQLLYRVYLTNNPPPTDTTGRIPLNLALQSSTPDGLGKWSYLTNKTNLINSTIATTPGEYTVEVRFEGAYTSNANNNSNKTAIIRDENGGNFYKAKFNLEVYSPTPYITLNWQPVNNSQDWFDSNNWDLGSVPNATSDVIINYQSGGKYPVINGTGNGGTARVHNLTVAGRDNNTRIGARLSLAQGSLYIYGDFKDLNLGFSQSATGYLFLAGTTQTFDASSRLRNLIITGGGTKTITGVVTIIDSLKFLPNSNGRPAGILATGTGNAGKFAVNLQPLAILKGETEGAYVLGTVITTRPLIQNESKPNTFGGIGLDLKTTGDVGNLSVTRTSSIYQGTGTSVSIRRGFMLVPDNTDPVAVDLTFHYLDEERNGIAPENLRLFSSETGDIPFVPLNKTSADIAAKTLTRNGITSSLLITFTLGNVNNPLPVTLTSFTATATPQGGALLRWTTASETNNRGFNIERQVGTDGSWTTIGFVAAGSTTGSAYRYDDKALADAPASDKAYYRLRQEDLNGKTSYSPVAAITRQAAVAATEMTLSPVPVSGSTLTLTMAEIGQAGIEVAIINTQGQRLTNFTTQASTQAALDLPVASLAAGVYIVSVRVPGQATRHARFVKM